MRPPFIARALLASITTQSAYDSVSGDLHEEYVRRAASLGLAGADRWYWSQALRSVVPLLASSDPHATTGDRVKLALAIGTVLVAMLVAGAFTNGFLDVAFRGAFAPLWLHFIATWFVVGLAGFALGALCRDRSVRVALVAAICFVGVFALPSLTGLSTPLLPLAWMLLLGVIPALTAGASVGLVIRRP